MEQKLLDRLNRLRAMAEDVNSEAEAMIAMRRLHSLLAKHNLSLVDLDNKNGQENIDQHSFLDVSRPWKKQIVNGIAKLYFCHLYIERVDKKKAMFVITGEEHNREFAVFLIENVIRVVDAQALTESKAAYGKRSVPFINSFRNGAAYRIAHRCFDMIRDGREGNLQDDEGNTLPALLDAYTSADQKIQDFLKNLDLNLKNGRTSKMKSSDPLGFVKGQKAGNSVQLSRAIQGKNSPKLLE